MSSNGNDDDRDDVDRLIREMRNTNRNLENVSSQLDALIDAIVRGARQDEDEGESPKIDLWDEGRLSAGNATEYDQYRQLRAIAANSEDRSVPTVTVDDNVEFFIEVFTGYSEHLQRIYLALNKREWKTFIQRYAARTGVYEDLIDILDPGTLAFGVNVVDGQVNVFESATCFDFLLAYDNIWFEPMFLVEGHSPFSSPWEALQMISPPEDEIDVLEGDVTPAQISMDLASSIEERDDLTLPEDRRDLL